MENKNRERTLLIGVAVAIGLLVVNMVVINPLTTSWKERREEIAKLTEQIAAGNSTIKAATDIESKWDHMRTNTLPDNSTLAESKLFTAFQGWEQASQITADSHRPTMMEPDEQDSGFKNEEFKVEAHGSLSQIFNFLYNVESSPMGLKVNSIELNSRDDQGRVLAVGLTVSGLILLPNTNSVPQ